MATVCSVPVNKITGSSLLSVTVRRSVTAGRGAPSTVKAQVLGASLRMSWIRSDPIRTRGLIHTPPSQMPTRVARMGASAAGT
jgi:hypothetical protein